MTLVDLDNNLRNFEKKELIYLYIMIVGGIFFLSYYFLFEYSEKHLKIAVSEQRKISKDMREFKNYISFHDEFEIGQLQNNIRELKDNIQLLKDKQIFISQKLNSLFYTIYNKESWTQFLKSISTVANSSGVEILYIKNQFLENRDLDIFQTHLTVQIKMNSNYINSLRFIDKIEKNNLVVSIDNLNMSLTEQGVITTMFISIWGIKKQN